MSPHKLYAIRIFSFRWKESLEFYRDIIGLSLQHEDTELGWAQFQLGSSFLGLERCDPNDVESLDLVGRFVGLSIEVSDIESVYDDLTRKGVEFTSPPTLQNWGGTLAHFSDPDKNIITLLGSPHG